MNLVNTTVLCGAVGILVGAFLNVVIWRIPRGESLRISGSGQFKVRTNVSVRHVTVAVSTALAFAATAWWIGPTWLLFPLLFLAAISIALSVIDLEHHRLPDAVVLPSIGVLALWFLSIAAVTSQWTVFGRAVLGAIVFMAVYLLMALVYPAGMGLGDVKLAPALGLVLGWWGWGAVVVGFFAAFLVGGIVAVALLLRGSHGRKSGVPFGPFMFIGTYIGLIWGNDVWRSYAHAIGG